MSKKKQLHNRLNDLFADMGEEENQISDNGSQVSEKKHKISGWNWQCDAVGYYTACSPEVEGVLGIEAPKFLGKLFTTFQLSSASSKELMKALEDGDNEALEISLDYIARSGTNVPVLTKIFRQDSADGEISGWRGFSQVIQTGTKPLAPFTPEEPTQKSTEPLRSTPETRRRLATDTFGIAFEEDEAVTVSSPYSGAGKQSLKKRESVSYPSAPGIEAALAVPFTLADESLGLLEIIDSNPDRQWNQDEQLLVEEVANQLSLALENAQLFQETQFSLARTEALFRVGQAAIAFEDLNELLLSVANTISEVLPANRTLVIVSDQEKEEITHFIQSQTGLMPINNETYQQLMEGLTGWVVREQKPALSNARMDDPRESKAARAVRQETDAGSVLVVPMIYRDEVYGTITAINSFTEAEFTQADLDLLMAMANQVATALANSQLFQQVTSRSEELALINRVVTQITGTLDIDVALQSIVKEISQALYIQAHIGLFDSAKTETEIVAFHSPVPDVPNLVGSRFTLEQSFGPATDIAKARSVVFEDVQNDPNLAQNHAKYRERNIFSFATFPITVGSDVIGLLTADIIERGRKFTGEEIRLIQAIITQTSTAIQSANLFQAEQRRRMIAATLSEISRTIGGSLDLGQIAERLLAQLTKVVEFDSASLEIVEGDRRESIGHINESRTDTAKIRSLSYRPISEDPLIREVVESKHPVVIEDTFADPRWERSPDNQRTHSWIAAPLLRGEDVTGLLILDHKNPGAFDDETADLLSGIAAQASVAIHNARLYQQAQARSAQLQTAAEVSRAASSILDPNPLIEQTVNLIRDRFDLYYVGLFIIDDSGALTREPGKWAVLRAGTGDAGRIQMERAHKLEVGGTSMIGQCITTSQPQISQRIDTEVDADGQRFINPLLPDTRSELALPLTSRGQVIGAMTIQSTASDAFSEEDIAILQTMADQIANALQNASLFDQTQIRAEELAVLNEMSRQLTSTVDLAAITRSLYLFTSRLIDTSTFFIALYDEITDSLTFPLAIEENQEITIHDNLPSQGLTKYVIDHREPLIINENIEEWLKDHGLEEILVGESKVVQTAQSWLGVPMLVGDNVIGIVNVQHRNSHHYSNQDNDLLMAIASQGAIAFQNASLFAETRQRTEDLAILNEMSRDMASLLDIDKVLTTAFEYTSKMMDTTNFFIALYDAQEEVVALPFVILKNEPVEVSPRQIGKGLSDYVIRNKKPLLLNGDDILRQEKEIGIERVAIGEGLPPKSWLGVPMMLGGNVIGVINVQSVTTPYLYQDRHRDLLTSIASQVAITIQNTRLFDQTRRQLRDLETISNASQTLSSAPLETTSVAEIIAHIFIELIGGNSTASVTLLESDMVNEMRTYVSLRSAEGKTEFDEDLELYNFKLHEYPATEKVMRELKPLIVNIEDSEADPQELAYMRTEDVKTLIVFPLPVKNQSIGVIELEYYDSVFEVSDEVISLGLTLANQAAVALENARLYVEQRETAEQLREVDTLKSQFLANMSHELRTPLNSIIGFSRVIMKGIDGPVTDMQQQDLSAIYNAGQHLLNMINDILDISKIEAGKMELAFDDVDIPNIVESVLSTARGLVKDKPVKLITEIDDDIPIITADPTRIRQVLLNLISNSAKFTDEGSITVTVRKQAKETGGRELYIAVTDTGTGIAEEDQHKLFVPFSQVDGSPTRKVEGTGLGLSITRLLIELHGGEINVDSTYGEGSTFWFTLPLPEDVGQSQGNGALTVLAIDDDAQVISLYERYLASAGFQVIPVTNPREALNEARNIRPFAITLDIMMPDFDGWQLLKELKADPDIGPTPVVICSILAEHEKGMKLGAADYLTKPILEDDLIHSLSKLKESL